MDFNLPDGTGAEATHKIVQDYPDCKVVFMTMSERDEDLMAAIRSGAVGYLLKNITPSKLVADLKSCSRGGKCAFTVHDTESDEGISTVKGT